MHRCASTSRHSQTVLRIAALNPSHHLLSPPQTYIPTSCTASAKAGDGLVRVWPEVWMVDGKLYLRDTGEGVSARVSAVAAVHAHYEG
eukprot:312343-Rhodomonas_salina.2